MSLPRRGVVGASVNEWPMKCAIGKANWLKKGQQLFPKTTMCLQKLMRKRVKTVDPTKMRLVDADAVDAVDGGAIRRSTK